MAPLFGVVVASVGINVKSEDVMMYLLHNGLNNKTVDRLQRAADKYKVGLQMIEIDSDILKNCPTNRNLHYGDIMTYARFLLPSLLPHLDKVLYLDCDLVVCQDLKSLWDIDVDDSAVAMAPDLIYKDTDTLKRLNIENGCYLNSGVIIMNLDYWRKHDVFHRIMDFIEENGNSLTYFDQDAINVVLQNERKILPVKYNVNPYHFHKTLACYPKELHEEIRMAIRNPVIFHFLGPIKPWSWGGVSARQEIV